MLARSYGETYDAVHEIRERVGVVTPQMGGALKSQARTTLLARWREWMGDARNCAYGRRVVSAIRPVLGEWVEGIRKRPLTFHSVQMLTGHGCFGQYLHRIGRERTTRCWHCPEEADTAQHTLELCPAWAEERRVLRAQIGQDLSPQAIVAASVEPGERGERNWHAFASFCSTVLRKKEADERVRRGEAAPGSSDGEGEEEEEED